MDEARLKARIRGDTIVLVECGESRICNRLRSNGKIHDDNVLDELEAGYLAYQGLLCIDGRCGWEAFHLVSTLVGNLNLLTVYIDLRRRGKRVLKGPSRDSLIVLAGSRSMEIHVLAEYREVTLSSLIDRLRISAGNNREPVIAVVDRTGVITYYEARVSQPS